MIARVSGRLCRHGVRVVSARLRDVPGVVSVEVNAAAGLVVVGGPVDAGQVCAALAEVGYSAEPYSLGGDVEPMSGRKE